MTLPAFAAERACKYAALVAVDRYLLPTGRSAANPPTTAAAVDGCDRQTDRRTRDGHGLGPSMGWVGLGWVAFFSTCDGLGGLG